MAEHILGVNGPSINIPTVAPVAPTPPASMAFGDFDDNWVISSTAYTVSPGTPVTAWTIASSPPSWLGSRINEVGIYAAGFIIRRLAGSSTGHLLAAEGFLNAAYAVPLDGLVALDQLKTAQGFGAGPFDHFGPIDVGVVGTPNVPPGFPVGWNADWVFYIPPAASDWQVRVTPFVQRLAYPA